ncbi:CinA family nicotinamide mononucleotide deamidase-related protein [Cetobacterium somerae]|uniref:CinA family nicotinamide mononucleotide deamidase-related protein n=1 Tax=Cetobacterium sp. NK01 TaxID=2993530 RepID=UPI002115ED3C|nr:CinA family nicotinamide mononucleotide deamidase-related protein [Cetobacterium sp. NK01]MCQ8211799.1 CinA family nicotinamide mononucleotide deamidase-related protein [Cetobacterium sp. NK01]
MRCTLILVGTELLNGATLDTNSVFMAEELNKAGIKIDYKLTVGDSLQKIEDALKFAKKMSDLVILSGGLGATDDDLTKEAIRKFLDKKFIIEDKELEEIKEKFRKLNIQFLNKNLKEVQKPEGAISIKNDVGMAPAFFVDGIAAFPGVPRELYNMFPKFLNFYTKNYCKDLDPIYIKDIIISGIPESILEEKIKGFFIEPNIEYEFLVKDYGIIVRMQTLDRYKNTVEKIKEKIYNSIGKYILTEDQEKIEDKIFKLLEKRNYTLSVAESCTGGMLSSTIVSVPGISKFFKEGLITYSNEAKIDRLNVNKNLIEKYGAVSKEVAKEMVIGLKTDVGISITGIAGPEGGTKDKPVGLVYIGVKVKEKVLTFKFDFIGDREKIRRKAVLHSLFELYKILEEDE